MRAYGFMEIEEGKRTHGMIFRLGPLIGLIYHPRGSRAVGA
jgi:hypothetical protein